jgi:hypothetical protein
MRRSARHLLVDIRADGTLARGGFINVAINLCAIT